MSAIHFPLANRFRLPFRISLLCLTLFSLLTTAAQAQQPAQAAPAQVANPKLANMLKQLESCREAVSKVQDYTATFHRVERLNDGRRVEQVVDLKQRMKPFSVYMNFRGGSADGQQVIYSEGWNNNQLRVKPTGLASLIGAVSVDPKGQTAMKDSRHPVTEIGFSGLLDGVLKMWKDDLQYPDLEVGFYKDAKISPNDPKSYYAFRTYHPQQRRVPRFQETRLYIDKQTLLPVHLENRAFPQQPGGKQILIERYTYSNIKLNVGLTQTAFLPQTYGF